MDVRSRASAGAPVPVGGFRIRDIRFAFNNFRVLAVRERLRNFVGEPELRFQREESMFFRLVGKEVLVDVLMGMVVPPMVNMTSMESRMMSARVEMVLVEVEVVVVASSCALAQQRKNANRYKAPCRPEWNMDRVFIEHSVTTMSFWLGVFG